MGYANVIEKSGKAKKWYDVVLRVNATMATNSTDEVIAKFSARGDAYCWAMDVSKRFGDQFSLIVG